MGDVTIRTPVDSDWSGILDAADAALPWAGDKNQEWLHNRQQFDTTTYFRYHCVGIVNTSERVIAYGAVEGGSVPGRYRIFLVMAPAYLNGETGNVLYNHLVAILDELNADVVWAREEACDLALINFLQDSGFAEAQRFTHSDGTEIVVLEKHILAYE
jgi:hypothetical protein